jgi:hypothetical protein
MIEELPFKLSCDGCISHKMEGSLLTNIELCIVEAREPNSIKSLAAKGAKRRLREVGSRK